ncbi:Beta-arrestin-1 [Cichlidogyrus casuarinus]|uniref:Beta-arrestin-1 n=1 Tax=Cichlidogyrus casuarinus TaxID=1844966 RepID=A0ABD2PPI1_9PLAT
MNNAASYKCTVAEVISDEDFPIHPSRTGWCKEYRLRPLLANNRDKCGLALDGDLKHEDTNLASSTIRPENTAMEPVGITVSYKVKIRLYLGFTLSDVCLELPFILTHPNPKEDELEDANSNVDLEEFDFTPTGRENGSDCEFAATDSRTNALDPSSSEQLIKTSYFDQLKDLFQEPDVVTDKTDHAATHGYDPSLNPFTTPKLSDQLMRNNNNNHSSSAQPVLVWEQISINRMDLQGQKKMASTDGTQSPLEDDMVFADFARLRMQNAD